MPFPKAVVFLGRKVLAKAGHKVVVSVKDSRTWASSQSRRATRVSGDDLSCLSLDHAATASSHKMETAANYTMLASSAGRCVLPLSLAACMCNTN